MSKFHPISPAEITACIIATDCLMAGDSEDEEEDDEEEVKKQREEEDSERQDEQNGYSE